MPHPAHPAMHKLFAAALVAAVLLVGPAAFAQPQEAPADQAADQQSPSASADLKWTVQVDPLTTALGFAHIQIERVLSEDLSIYLGPSLRLYSSVFDAEPSPFTGLGVEGAVRYFISGTAPRGMWVQARGVFARLSTDKDGGQTGWGGYGSAIFGYTWIFSDRWVAALGAGVNYLKYTIAGMGTEGWLPGAHTAIGLAF